MFKGYITNLAKYTEGELVGEWVQFPIDEDELEKVLERIGSPEEYFFTDWDGENLGEYINIDEVNELAGTWEDEEDKAEAILDAYGFYDLANTTPDDWNLYEDINGDYDLGYYWIEESGCYDLRELGTLANYIDYEAFGRDVRFESDGAFSCHGWLERC